MKKKGGDKKRLFNGPGPGSEGDENSRGPLGMDEDSNMSNMSTASDSQDGMAATMTGKEKEEETLKCIVKIARNSFVNINFSLLILLDDRYH